MRTTTGLFPQDSAGACTTGSTFCLTCDADASVRGCPCPGSRRWRQAKAGCRKRRRHRVNGGQDARSERRALGAGQARTPADRVNYWMLPVVPWALSRSSPQRHGCFWPAPVDWSTVPQLPSRYHLHRNRCSVGPRPTRRWETSAEHACARSTPRPSLQPPGHGARPTHRCPR